MPGTWYFTYVLLPPTLLPLLLSCKPIAFGHFYLLRPAHPFPSFGLILSFLPSLLPPIFSSFTFDHPRRKKTPVSVFFFRCLFSLLLAPAREEDEFGLESWALLYQITTRQNPPPFRLTRHTSLGSHTQRPIFKTSVRALHSRPTVNLRVQLHSGTWHLLSSASLSLFFYFLTRRLFYQASDRRVPNAISRPSVSCERAPKKPFSLLDLA